MRPPRLLVLACCVALGALALRLPLLGADLFHTDSVFQARAVESWVLRGEFASMHRPGYPGQVLLAAPIFWLHHTVTGATSAAFAVTLQSALAGAVAAGLAVLFARPFLRTDLGAVFAGVLAAALPALLSTTTFAMSHGSQAALLLGAGIAAERRRALVTGLLLGLAVATRTESVLVAPALAALLWRTEPPLGFDRERGVHLRVPASGFVRRAALFAVPVLAVPLALYAKQLATDGLAAWREAGADTGWLGPVSAALPAGLAGTPRALSWPALLLAAAGLVVIARRDRARLAVLLLWTVPVFVFVANTSIVVPRHLIVALLPLVVPAAAALEWGDGARRHAATAALAGVAAAMVVPLLPVLRARHERCLPADFAREVARSTPDDAVVLAMDFAEHLDYFAHRRTLQHEPLFGGPDDDARVADALRAVGDLLRSRTPVYVVSDAFAYDAPHPDHGLARVRIGGDDGAEEALGRFGIALVETYSLELVGQWPYEDWHGAALGPRLAAPPSAALYRVVPDSE